MEGGKVGGIVWFNGGTVGAWVMLGTVPFVGVIEGAMVTFPVMFPGTVGASVMFVMLLGAGVGTMVAFVEFGATVGAVVFAIIGG